MFKSILEGLKTWFFNVMLSNGSIQYDEYCERVLVINETVLFPDGDQAPLLQYAEDITLDIASF